jgi:ATP synthase subunit 6
VLHQIGALHASGDLPMIFGTTASLFKLAAHGIYKVLPGDQDQAWALASPDWANVFWGSALGSAVPAARAKFEILCAGPSVACGFFVLALPQTWSEGSVATGQASGIVGANIALISSSGPWGPVHLSVTEILSSFLAPVYRSTWEHLFYLSTKDFSYLIFSLNTSTIWLSLGLGVATLLLTTILPRQNGAALEQSRSVTLISKNNWQTMLEILYEIILGVVNENAGPKGIKYFPLIFTTFLIILICNLFGMIPYSFTVTSHLIVTFSVALAIFIGINILGILKNRRHFLSLFFPPGAPLALAPLLVFIELVSYAFRTLSLSIRLFANLMSGHTLLKILSTFAWAAVSFWGIFLIPCVIIIFLVTGLEIAIAVLQAYIFSVLLCIYINDAFNLH